MFFVRADPEALVAAASDLAGVNSTLGTANAAAAAPTTGIVASAADEVSAQVAALLSEHGLGYQQLSSQMAAFHERFVQTLTAGVGAYAATEANAAQALAGAGAAGGTVSAPAGAVSNALGHIESAVLGSNVPGAAGLFSGSSPIGGAASQVGALLLPPTGGISALTAARALLAPAGMTNPGLVPAATTAAFGDGIKAAYLTFEPYVQYGFQLAAYAVGFVPYVGFLAPQINIFYNLIEPIVQSGLFNTLDILGGQISFAQGLNNFFTATTASIGYFINSEINWLFGYILPPLPPLPPFF
jgi:PE family